MSLTFQPTTTEAVWIDEEVPAEDPLRQGDLLVEVVFPDLRLPLSFYEFRRDEPATTLPARQATGLVVSQCCTNVDDDYAAVAPVSRMKGNISDAQRAALLAEEPTQEGHRLTNYDLEHFALTPISGVLDERGGRIWVANLNRAVPFYGECSQLRTLRRARMTVVARRLLRIKLSLFWSRTESEDAAQLEALGLPPGLS